MILLWNIFLNSMWLSEDVIISDVQNKKWRFVLLQNLPENLHVLSFLQCHTNPVTAVCILMGTLQTGAAHSKFSTFLMEPTAKMWTNKANDISKTPKRKSFLNIEVQTIKTLSSCYKHTEPLKKISKIWLHVASVRFVIHVCFFINEIMLLFWMRII